MSSNVTGIINWLKGWFYDKGEVDTALSNKIDKSSSDTGFVKSNGNIVDFGTSATTVAKGNHTHNNLAITRNLASGEDLDDLTTTGWYYVGNIKYTNFINAPTPTTTYSYFLIYVQKSNGNVWTQTLYTLPSGTNKSEIFYRKKYSASGAWTSWSKIATTDDIPTSFPASQITGLSTVATSGSYNDLSNKPSSLTPSSHTHGNITNAGAIGSAANKPIITTTSGKLTAGSFGTTANTFCQGNDSRLSDARTPLAHTHSKSDITNLPTWTVLYDSTFGTIKTNGELVSLIFTSGSKTISNSSWTEMAKLSSINIASTYYPKTTLYGYFNNQIEMRLTTDGILQAVRRTGSTSSAVTFHAVYLII